MGFSGVQNFPTVGLFDGIFRQNLEETGMGYDLEVAMIRQAHDLDLLTAPYVFTPEEARRMTEAGADVLVPHVGLTTSGTIGATTAITLDEAVARVQAMHDAATSVNPDVLVLCHGGPIAAPEDAAYVLAHTHGMPASSAPPASSACRPSAPSPARWSGSKVSLWQGEVSVGRF